ncbi:MAG: carboxyl transferase domain-containing protein [Rubrivivax sp.]|nr:carboxyl transferase domain-containing protein [Rubrivivax sp.]
MAKTQTPAGMRERTSLGAPVQGAVIAIEVVAGQAVSAGQTLVLLDSMKMEVPLVAPQAGTVRALLAAVGDVVAEGDILVELSAATGLAAEPAAAPADSGLRADLLALQQRRALLLDAARPEAMARRQAQGRRSARANLADLLDEGSLSEYGGFAVAAQRSRRSLDDLQRQTPADGLVCGTGSVNAALFGAERAQVTVLAYDYTVLAGTQGVFNHRKSDRVLELAERLRLPVVLFAEGGGGRPGDVDWLGVAGLDCTTFQRFARLSGQVPRVGIVSGRCFAGNAALLGCCDIIIATEGSSIGMGGPAMIEGGGLGRVAADEVGPVAMQSANGVVDLRVADDAAAVAAARQYLGYFQGALASGAAAGAQASTLRQALPANRNALYEPREILHAVFDAGSVLELRREFGLGVVTALARLDGRAVAVAASQPRHLGGALDAPACDKLARFMQLADAFGLPLITFVDTPGFMVGPASEATAMVRHASRLFVTAAALRVPVLSVVLRRGYGLGAMALTAGHFHAPVATAAWPNAEFGAMGIEGAVRLGFRKELEAAPADERDALFQRLVDAAIERGQALNMASHLEIDDVIDPADTRPWLLRGLAAACARELPPRRGFIDTW